MTYEPTADSVRRHQVPEWYHDAKLGIFIHWGLYSVPGWAPHGADIDQQVAEHGWEAVFANNPYSEWYLNSLRLGNTPTVRHHAETYGANFSYDDFAPMFERAVEQWNPDEWAALFEQIGARYVVLTTKHHDGYLLWPSALTSPHKPSGFAAKRDLVGDLTAAVREHNLRMGLYYSGGLDWSFSQTPIRTESDVRETIVQSPEFIEYVDAHWRELIDRYAPSILWNDIGAPAAQNLPDLFAHYYNAVPEGVIDDRWNQRSAARGSNEWEATPTTIFYGDFTTPEYATYPQIVAKKWEATRGIGHSFGYNQNEGPDDYQPVEKLVRSFVDIVSKNGNLLLDIGPMADGTIPELQRERLLGLGAWLGVNGEAIFGTRPWVTAEGKASENLPLRFTQKNGSLYAILLGTPSTGNVTLEKLHAADDATISLLGQPGSLTWAQQGENLSITLPALSASPAHTIQITPAPEFIGR